jgi:hypothetical protein
MDQPPSPAFENRRFPDWTGQLTRGSFAAAMASMMLPLPPELGQQRLRPLPNPDDADRLFRLTDYQRITAVLRRISVRHFPLPVELGVHWPWHPHLVCALVTVSDRESGEPLKLCFHRPLKKWATDKDVADEVRRHLKWVATHEVDECLYLDGVRIFDPHKDGVLADPEF